MLTKFQSWHKGLSRGKKILVWGVTAFVGLMVIGAANPQPQTATLNTVNTASHTAAIEATGAKPNIETKEVIETSAIPFEKTTTENASLAQGKTQIITAGVAGVRSSTYMVTYTDGVAGNKVLIKDEVTTAPVSEVTAVGTYVAPAPAPKAASTSSCDPNYSPCVPLVSYDLDCKDIGFRVQVIGSDRHRFDRDGDGIGCESY